MRTWAVAALAWGRLLAPPGAENPPVVLEGWEIVGDPLLDRDAAVRLFPWEIGTELPPAAPDSAAGLLRDRLLQAGWWGAEVLPATRGGTIVLDVRAGEPVVVGEIDVRGNHAMSREEVLSRVEMREGRLFDEAEFRSDVARVLRAYSERGHPLARVYPSGFRRTPEGRLAFQFRIGEGPPGRIESVRVFGNTNTAAAVVARIAGVQSGDAWNVRRVETMASRLRREGLFHFVGEPRIVRGSRDDLIGLEIEVEEGPQGSVFGVVGYNPNPQGGGEVVGQADLRLLNMLGTARRASLRFQRQSGDVRDLAFRYREPWLLGTPVSVEVGAAQSLRDTLYSRTDLDAALSVPVRTRSLVGVAAERRSSTSSGAAGEDVRETQTGGSVSLAYDARDRLINPGRGVFGSVLVGSRRTRDDVLRSRLEADAHWLLPVAGRWVLSERGGFRGVQSSRGVPPLPDRYFLGGTNTVRGYREEQFQGERVWWIRSELRYRSSVRSRAYAFWDAGGTEPGARLLSGGGIGMALEARSQGLVRVEVAMAGGDSFSDAKVHAALEQEF